MRCRSVQDSGTRAYKEGLGFRAYWKTGGDYKIVFGSGRVSHHDSLVTQDWVPAFILCSWDYMSYNLNSLKGVTLGMIYGTTIRLLRGIQITRNIDYGLYRISGLQM